MFFERLHKKTNLYLPRNVCNQSRERLCDRGGLHESWQKNKGVEEVRIKNGLQQNIIKTGGTQIL
jgi:hypothetical protein